jgi:hypothetical protein
MVTKIFKITSANAAIRPEYKTPSTPLKLALRNLSTAQTIFNRPAHYRALNEAFSLCKEPPSLEQQFKSSPNTQGIENNPLWERLLLVNFTTGCRLKLYFYCGLRLLGLAPRTATFLGASFKFIPTEAATDGSRSSKSFGLQWR